MRARAGAWGGLAGLVLLGGCTVIFGDVDKRECRSDTDCPGIERCASHGRCVTVGDIDGPTPDAGVPDDGMVALPPLDMAVDLGLDMAPDMADAGPSGAPFPGGDCFGGRVAPPLGFVVSPAPEGLHQPQFACTPYALVWTVDGADGPRVVWDRDGDFEADDEAPLAPGGRFVAEGARLLLPSPNPLEGDQPNVYAVDLETGAGEFVAPTGFAQRDPVRVPGRTLFVERGADGLDEVVIVVHGRTVSDYLHCGGPGLRQWGVTGGEGWTAWFEQRVGSRIPRLVVTDETCGGARRERLLPRPVADDVALLAAPDGVVWLQAAEDGRANQIYRWGFRRFGQEPEPLTLAGPIGNPIELAARGGRLSVLAYEAGSPPRYLIDLVDIATGGIEPGGEGRRPALSDSYLMWVVYEGGPNAWRLGYVRL